MPNVKMLRSPVLLSTRVILATPTADGRATLPGVVVSKPFETETGVVAATFTRISERQAEWPTRVMLVTVAERSITGEVTAEMLMAWATEGREDCRMAQVPLADFREDVELLAIPSHTPGTLYSVYALGVYD